MNNLSCAIPPRLSFPSNNRLKERLAMELRGRNLEGVLLFSIAVTTAITALLGVAQLYLMIR
jgi:hypothetical protein